MIRLRTWLPTTLLALLLIACGDDGGYPGPDVPPVDAPDVPQDIGDADLPTCATDADCARFENGDLCDGTLICQGGRCIVDDQTVVLCPAPSGPCREMACNPDSGACEERQRPAGAACDIDNNGCTLDACDTVGTCIAGPYDIDNPQCPCITSSHCDDHDECTADVCQNGECIHQETPCDDGIACTVDSCDPTTGLCSNVADDTLCADGEICTNDTCDVDRGECTHVWQSDCGCQQDAECDDLDPCTVDACDPVERLCTHDFDFSRPVECPWPCTGAAECDDGNACTTDDCVGDSCVWTAAVCDDGDDCTVDTCDPALGCDHQFDGTLPGCGCTADADCAELAGPCVLATCNEATGACETANVADGTACDDGDPCSGGDLCTGGLCAGETGCDDGDPCTVDTCVLGDGCLHTPNPALPGCGCLNDDECSEFAGVCLVGACNADTGLCEAVPAADGAACDDDDACTEADVCTAGSCGGSLVDCGDGDDCTLDRCEPAAGCIHAPDVENPACNVCLPQVVEPALSCGATLADVEVASGTDALSLYACTDETSYPGREHVYALTVDTPTWVDVQVTANYDAAVLVLGGLCNPDYCIGASDIAGDWPEQLQWLAEPGVTYYVAVDSIVASNLGTFSLNVDCAVVELDCGDGSDNDGDGLTDCADLDCAALPACFCTGDVLAGCDAAESGDTSGSTSMRSEYACAQFPYSGPEHVYAYTAEADGPVAFSLTTPFDGALIVLDDQCAADDLGSCLAAVDDGLEGDTETLIVDLLAGHTYFVVVEGYGEGAGAFDLSVACLAAEVCDDGNDNDGDGLTDCDDAVDCGSFPACNPVESDCANELDDDGDGDTDCADDDCVGDPACAPGETVCDDGADDDGDGDTDCADSDCAASPVCFCVGATDLGGCNVAVSGDTSAEVSRRASYACAVSPFYEYPGPERVFTFAAAATGQMQAVLRSDFDGALFLLDAQCLPADPAACLGSADENGTFSTETFTFSVTAGTTYYLVVEGFYDYSAGPFDLQLVCEAPENDDAACADQLDNDFDGDVDCLDSDCTEVAYCQFEAVCTDGIDNDADGAADCADDDCGADPACEFPEATCDDDFDNDGDGLADCLDDSCDGTAGCEFATELACRDGFDNDGDGALDCADSDCEGLPACVETQCADGQDNDGDGQTDCADDDCAGEPACHEADCGDGQDNDGDGQTDCADGDCEGSPDCATANDFCSGARLIAAAGEQQLQGDTTGAGAEYPAEEPRASDLWYTFNLEVATLVSLVMEGQDDWDTYLFLATGHCDALTELASDDDCGYVGRSCIEAVLEPGVYFVIASGYSGDSAGPFTLAATFLPVPDTYTCDFPGTLEEGENAGDTTAADATVANPSCGDPDSPGRDEVWSFYNECEGTVELTLDTDQWDAVLSIEATCGDSESEIVCLDRASGFTNEVLRTNELAPYAEYTVVVSGYDATEFGAYTLNYRCVPLPENDTCENGFGLEPSGTQTVTGTTIGAENDWSPLVGPHRGPDVFYTFHLDAPASVAVDLQSDPGFNTYVFLLAGACESLAGVSHNDNCAGDDTRSCLTINTLPAGDYAIVVSGADDWAMGEYTLSVTFGEPLAAARNCNTPGEIVAGNNYGDTRGASMDAVFPTTCVTENAADDLWAFTAPCSGFAYVRLTPDAWDSVLAVYATCGNNETLLGCDDQGVGLPEEIDFSIQQGLTYYVLVTAVQEDGAGPYTLYFESACT